MVIPEINPPRSQQNPPKLKVALVSRFPMDMEKTRGGVESATVGLAKALYEYGIKDLHVITLEKHLPKVKTEDHGGITVHRLPQSRLPMMLDVFIGPTAKQLKQYLEKLQPDIVHFHETWGLGASSYSLPNIFTVHGFDSLNLATTKKPGWQLRCTLWKIAEKIGLKNQKFLVSIAPYVKGHIQTLTNAKIFDIWNPLNIVYFSVTKNERPNTILFLGWLDARKNPLVIIEATALIAAKYPDLKVRLAGEAYDADYYETLLQRTKQLKLENQIEFLGRITQSQVREQLSVASMLILPSLQENAPMVIAEAMACGTPVIASNLCGIPDMLQDGQSGYLIDPHDVKALASKIDDLLSDGEKRSRFGKSAKQEALYRYHPSAVAEAICNAYSTVLNQR